MFQWYGDSPTLFFLVFLPASSALILLLGGHFEISSTYSCLWPQLAYARTGINVCVCLYKLCARKLSFAIVAKYFAMTDLNMTRCHGLDRHMCHPFLLGVTLLEQVPRFRVCASNFIVKSIQGVTSLVRVSRLTLCSSWSILCQP